MADNESTEAPAGRVRESDPCEGETLLQIEVTFWRELLQSDDPDRTTSCTERMQYALALAESRLAIFREHNLPTVIDNSGNRVAIH